MRVAVLGTGDVGRTLAEAFVRLGHDVKLGSRSGTNEKAVAWTREAGPRASAGSFADAAAFGEIITVATLGSATEAALRAAGPEHFRGKTVIDTTNPLDFSQGMPRLFVGFTDSLGERVQRMLPGARVVKAFNTVGHALMYRPELAGGPPDMFIGGDDEGKRTVAEILSEFGWGIVDLGGIETSRYLEPMCLIWVLYGIRTSAWTHAFKLLKR
jgi:8-hydroxy-5-deazaflavin:NADPH oxidoreductase